MIKGYKLVYSPTSDKRFRYKVKLSADEASCLGIIKEIGPVCGRPFKNIGSDFKKAFYVYGSSNEIKSQIISALKKHPPTASPDSRGDTATLQRADVIIAPETADLTATPETADLTAAPETADLTATPETADLTATPETADLTAAPVVEDASKIPKAPKKEEPSASFSVPEKAGPGQ
ncbi:MAG: hypothetical protein U9O97_04905, partial [Elusimicrobiota bacterium]|nr:hypothetical protein [Elusimicrobiota bacterium]